MNKQPYRKVYETKWLGLVCATKQINIEFEKLFIKEVRILASLSHRNLVKYYFIMKGIANKRRQSHITMKKKILIYGNGIDANKLNREA